MLTLLIYCIVFSFCNSGLHTLTHITIWFTASYLPVTFGLINEFKWKIYQFNNKCFQKLHQYQPHAQRAQLKDAPEKLRWTTKSFCSSVLVAARSCCASAETLNIKLHRKKYWHEKTNWVKFCRWGQMTCLHQCAERVNGCVIDRFRVYF